MYTIDVLRNLTLKDLKTVAKEVGISGYSKYNSETRDELEDMILQAQHTRHNHNIKTILYGDIGRYVIDPMRVDCRELTNDYKNCFEKSMVFSRYAKPGEKPLKMNCVSECERHLKQWFVDLVTDANSYPKSVTIEHEIYQIGRVSLRIDTDDYIYGITVSPNDNRMAFARVSSQVLLAPTNVETLEDISNFRSYLYASIDSIVKKKEFKASCSVFVNYTFDSRKTFASSNLFVQLLQNCFLTYFNLSGGYDVFEEYYTYRVMYTNIGTLWNLYKSMHI